MGKYIIVPREYNVFAVEIALLKSITDQVCHSGATFTSAMKVWSGQHNEVWQTRLILGDDNTLGRRTRDALMQAWFVWQAIRYCPQGVRE